MPMTLSQPRTQPQAPARLEWPLPELPDTVRFYRVRTPVAPALNPGAGAAR